MELEKINIDGVNDTYALSVIKKEFKDAVNEPWKEVEPWQGYQKKLLQDLAVLDLSKEKAIDLPQFEKLSGEENLYCIHRPRSRKNIRIIYTIYDDCINCIFREEFRGLSEGDKDSEEKIEMAGK